MELSRWLAITTPENASYFERTMELIALLVPPEDGDERGAVIEVRAGAIPQQLKEQCPAFAEQLRAFAFLGMHQQRIAGRRSSKDEELRDLMGLYVGAARGDHPRDASRNGKSGGPGQRGELGRGDARDRSRCIAIVLVHSLDIAPSLPTV